ncbi:hypothetical protein KY331_01715 [Candidatus Woesearchaeota archaeon]|nr:hypothetical protein [Candidatus Woesearchaeota archaeon]
MKKIHLENDKREHVPTYEIKCPFCGNKVHVEEYVSDFAASIFCHYCGQKLTISQ